VRGVRAAEEVDRRADHALPLLLEGRVVEPRLKSADRLLGDGLREVRSSKRRRGAERVVRGSSGIVGRASTARDGGEREGGEEERGAHGRARVPALRSHENAFGRTRRIICKVLTHSSHAVDAARCTSARPGVEYLRGKSGANRWFASC